MRVLLLKVVNSVDVGKLHSLFEQLETHLGTSEDPNRLTLLFKVFN